MSDGSNPFPGTAPNLIPNPPGEIPDAMNLGDAVGSLNPFVEPQDIDQIIAQLTLDRPLKLFIPNREKYTGWEFRIINSIPQEIADAHNKGWRQVTDPDLTKLFEDLVAGTDKTGKAFRPMLFSRSTKIGEIVRKRNRATLRSLYAGMDPANKEFDGKYTENAGRAAGSKGQFSGPAWRIKV
jgi:hypothetical protein